ncbi:MAG: glycosyltransferase [Candidatus Aquicultorales bacterium]
MSTSISDAVILFSGAHPAHQELLKDIAGDRLFILGPWTPDRRLTPQAKFRLYIKTALELRKKRYRLIICEGAILSSIVAFFAGKSRIVALCAEDAFYQAFVEKRMVKKAVLKLGFRRVSGIVAIGDIVFGLASDHFPSKPLTKRYPPMVREMALQLSNLKPALDSHDILLIGGGSSHMKGLDVAISCVSLLKRKFAGARLHVLGFSTEDQIPGVAFYGPVEDIKPFMEKCSVVIHPGRGEAFGLGVVEGMLAGLVPFVSEWTGAKLPVSRVSGEFVIDVSPKAFAYSIERFWRSQLAEKQRLSDSSREAGKAYVDMALAQPSLSSFLEGMLSDSREGEEVQIN